MRIARVLTRPNLGGPARQVMASDPLLAERGHVVRVFCGEPEPGEGDLFDELERRGVDTVRVPGLRRSGAPLRDLGVVRRLARGLREFEPDVVHTHASKAGLLGRLAAPRGAARVHTFHGHVLEGYFSVATSRLLTAMERALARRTDAVVAVSDATRADLARLRVAPDARIATSPPGVDLEPFLALDPAPRRGPLRAAAGSDAFLVAFVGRLAAVKRPAFAGAVLRELRGLGVDARLVVLGDGPAQLLEELVRAAGAERGSVLHLGAREDVALVLAECDAVLSCSRNEGAPVALIEAAAAARPAVAVGVGGVAEVVVDGDTGTVLPHDATPGEVARELARLAADPRLREQLGARARGRACERYSAKGLADRLERIYRTALARRGDVRFQEVPACGS
ncbi:MAG: glycosyltransferase [Planctomycetota bacterium]